MCLYGLKRFDTYFSKGSTHWVDMNANLGRCVYGYCELIDTKLTIGGPAMQVDVCPS